MKRFVLRFIWLRKAVAVCLDQKIAGFSNPLTVFYFWPERDAWEDIQLFLEKNRWITREESISLLNELTDVINGWQDKQSYSFTKKDLGKLKEKFPNTSFVGFSYRQI